MVGLLQIFGYRILGFVGRLCRMLTKTIMLTDCILRLQIGLDPILWVNGKTAWKAQVARKTIKLVITRKKVNVRRLYIQIFFWGWPLIITKCRRLYFSRSSNYYLKQSCLCCSLQFLQTFSRKLCSKPSRFPFSNAYFWGKRLYCPIILLRNKLYCLQTSLWNRDLLE